MNKNVIKKFTIQSFIVEQELKEVEENLQKIVDKLPSDDKEKFEIEIKKISNCRDKISKNDKYICGHFGVSMKSSEKNQILNILKLKIEI